VIEKMKIGWMVMLSQHKRAGDGKLTAGARKSDPLLTVDGYVARYRTST
jgi:hypothetical protein